MDEFCERCQARLAEGAEWCSQCLAPVVRPEPAPAHLPATEPRTFLDPRIGRKVDPGETKYTNPPEFSRWKKGPSSFGWVGRAAITVALAIVLVGAFTVVHAGIYMISGGYLVPANQLRIIYGIPATLFGIYLAIRIWKPARVK